MEQAKSAETNYQTKSIVRVCHRCGHVNESSKELQRCKHCHKPFLPLNYLDKVHNKDTQDFKNMFASSEELGDEDMIKGLTVLW